jgi:predicted double-glycine peptidase
MKGILLPLIFVLGITGCTVSKKRILDFPNTRQAYDYSCGPGAVQAVMAYYGVDFRESELVDSLKTNEKDGTLVKDIVRFLHSQGFSTDVKEHMSQSDLFRYIDKRIPVIALIQAWGKKADFDRHYADTWDDGHFVVVIGYTPWNIICSDPSMFSTGYIPIAEFLDRWHDYDEGETRTYHLGIAVYGTDPVYNKNEILRIK